MEKQTAIKKNTSIKKGKSKENLILLSLCMPLILYEILFNIVPIPGLIIAFKDYKFNLGIIGSKWVGLKYFKMFFSSNDFLRILRNTFCYNIVFIILGFSLAILFAIMLYYITKKTFIKIYQTIFLIPSFLSWVIVAYMLYAFLNADYGLINNILKTHIDWYVTPHYWIYIIVFAQIWKTVGYSGLMYYASLMGMDDSIIEAAKVDGAKRWQITRYILIPHLTPLACMLMISAVGGIFNSDFGLFYQLPMGSPMLISTTDTISTYTYRLMKDQGNMSLSSAVSLVTSVVGLICILSSNMVIKKINPENSLF